MTRHHWTADHVSFVRRHFSAEIGNEPMYIRCEHESGLDPYPHGADAYTSTTLDLSMKNALQAHGQWCGRGFAMALPADGLSFHKMSWPMQLNLCLHELCHHLADRPKILDDADPPPETSSPLAVARRADVPLFQHDNVYEHGPEFVRAALHIHRRASPDADIGAMQVFHEQYRSPPLYDALNALDDELRTGGDIVDIMATKAPAAFLALWPSDDDERASRLVITRRILDEVWAAHGLMPATT